MPACLRPSSRRATEQSFLRLVSTPAIFNAYRSDPITNRDALSALAAFAALPQVDLIEEPPELEALWWRLAGLEEAASDISLERTGCLTSG